MWETGTESRASVICARVILLGVLGSFMCASVGEQHKSCKASPITRAQLHPMNGRRPAGKRQARAQLDGSTWTTTGQIEGRQGRQWARCQPLPLTPWKQHQGRRASPMREPAPMLCTKTRPAHEAQTLKARPIA
jgi:hypothetical protein